MHLIGFIIKERVKCVIAYEDKRLPIVCIRFTFGLSSSTRRVSLQDHNKHEMHQARIQYKHRSATVFPVSS